MNARSGCPSLKAREEVIASKASSSNSNRLHRCKSSARPCGSARLRPQNPPATGHYSLHVACDSSSNGQGGHTDGQGLSSSLLESILEAAQRASVDAEAEEKEEHSTQETSPSRTEEDDYSKLVDRIGFLGAGQMGEALIRGFIATGVSDASKICASVRSAKRQEALAPLGITVFGNALDQGAADVAANSEIIIIGVKPHHLDSILEALRPHLTPDHLVISIAAGVKLASLESGLPEGARVVRVMPNTPCLIGQAASAYVPGNNASEEDSKKTFALMSAVGMTTSVEERMMDAVTGLSGSGPAFIFLIIEAMADGAVAAGLPRDKALALAAQTVIGASRMVGQIYNVASTPEVLEASGDGTMSHPATLKDKVASPAGTTIAGLAELETSGVRGALIRAVRAAARRSEELG